MNEPRNPYDAYLNMPGEICPARSVGSLAPMSFLENLDVDADSNLVFTSMLDGRVWRLPFGGHPEPVAQVQGRPSGIAAAPEEGWLAFGWTLTGGAAAFDIKPSGAWTICAEMPEVVFPNGALRLPNGRYLFADSIAATIWEFDYASRSVAPWYRHALLAPNAGRWEPGLNGLRLWGDRLYMTNSSKASFLSMPIQDGRPAGEAEIVMSDIHADDFAFDEQGTAYLTTHPHDVVLKLTQAGTLTRIAGPEQGVRGCTACRFGRRAGDETGLYVVTDGGLFNPASGGLQPAQIIRLETDVHGAPT